MAQSGFTPILIYSSTTASAAPSAGNLTNSALGSELAINIVDGKLFYKDGSNNVQVIAWKTTPTTAGGTGLTTYAAGDLLYYASGTVLSKLTIGASKTILTSSGTAPQWSASLDTTQGGTGLTSYTAGDLPYYATGTTLAKLAIGTNTQILTSNGTAPVWTSPSSVSIGTATNLAGGAQGSLPYQSAAGTTVFLAKNTTATRYLANTGTNNNPDWAQIDLSNGVTGTLPVGNGGTGATTFTAGRILFGNTTSAINTSANLFWDNANNRLGIGTSSPSYPFQLAPGGGYSDQIAIFNEASTWTGNGGTVIADYYNATTMICGIKYSASTSTSGFVTIHAGGTTERARFAAGGGLSIGTTTTPPTNGILLPVNGVLNSDGGTVYSTSIAGSTTGAGANMYVDAAGGFIQRSTSSIKYKTDIEDLEPNRSSSIYKMRPVWYRSLCEMDRKDWSYYGLIAEEVGKIEPRLVFWGEKNEDGTQQAEGVMYDRLTVFLLAELQKQQKEIEQLKKKVGV